MARRQAQKLNARQEKIAAIQAEQARKKRRLTAALGALGAVVVVVLALVIVNSVQGQSGPTGSGSSTASAKVVGAVAGVPQSVFDKVGAGSGTQPPQPIQPAAPRLTASGKPRVMYAGAEYCPYCAAERWAVVAAMSRFGTFHNLGETTSSSQDVYPSTATLSFHGASYDSKYLSFSGYEMQSNQRQGSSYAPLDKLPPADQKLFQTYDAPPHVPSQSAGSIPFVDIGGKYFISGASYDPATLKGLSHQQIAKALSDPNSPVAKNVLASANQITAALCKVTGNQPSNVCTSPGVTAAAKTLSGG